MVAIALYCISHLYLGENNKGDTNKYKVNSIMVNKLTLFEYPVPDYLWTMI